MPKRKTRKLSPRTIKAAKLVAAGASQLEAASEVGMSQQSVSKAVNAVLNYEQFEDVRNCRMIANRRLDSLRRHLLGMIGLVDDDEGGTPPKPSVEPTGHARIASVLVKIEERRASMFGFDAPKHVVVKEEDPLESMSPEDLLASCRTLNIPIPPGLVEEVDRRAASNRLTQGGGGGSKEAR